MKGFQMEDKMRVIEVAVKGSSYCLWKMTLVGSVRFLLDFVAEFL
jgi:hypothetical protein